MNTTLQKKAKPGSLTYRHVLVLITGILISFGPATMVFNNWSILVVPVCNGLGVSTNVFTLYVSIMFLASALIAFVAGDLMERFDLRIVLTAACVLTCGAMFMCSFYTEVWQFYVSGVLEGFGALILISLAAPTLVNRWFRRNIGLLVGICAASTGVGAAVWSMLGGFLLTDFDWRACYQVFAIIGAIVSVPASFFFVRSYPEDVGLLPFGANRQDEESAEEVPQERSISAKKAFRMPIFVLLCITMALVNGATQMANYLATYMYHLSDIGAMGVTAATAVFMASVVSACVQVAQAGGKIVLGQIVDHSLKAALITMCLCGVLGTVFVWIGPGIGSGVIYTGSVLFGVFVASPTLLGPTITRYLFGPKDYTPIYSRVSVFLGLAPAVFIQLYAWLADTNWDLLFGVSIAILLLTFVFVLLLIRQIKYIQQKD